MVPRKYRELIKPVAEEHGCKESLVDNLISLYYKEVRRAVSDLKYPNIKIENLGYFRIKHWKLDELREAYTKAVAKADLNTFKGMARKKDFDIVVEKIEAIQKLVQHEADRKKELKSKKNEAIDTRRLEE